MLQKMIDTKVTPFSALVAVQNSMSSFQFKENMLILAFL